ncbi:hypothetical protein KM043_018861 [Ampulex compressa]|nr:hypothetical protein KM043_018861 [Ampulex compressa]
MVGQLTVGQDIRVLEIRTTTKMVEVRQLLNKTSRRHRELREVEAKRRRTQRTRAAATGTQTEVPAVRNTDARRPAERKGSGRDTENSIPGGKRKRGSPGEAGNGKAPKKQRPPIIRERD